MLRVLAAALVATDVVSARSVKHMQNWQSLWHLPGGDHQHVPTSGNTTFNQLIDHNNPGLGCFEQYYMYDTTYWKGPGSPVVLFTPGEVNATKYASYLTTNRTTGVFAEKVGAAVIVLEHRYWGTSTPFTDLTTENMKYLTLDNSIKDLTYFAREAKLPFAHGRASSNADAVPWVMMGGSYSGALSAWTESVDPGTIWAYHASSAPVQAISDYWGYFLPVQEGMPKNCSKDVNLVIDYMDNILLNGTAQQQHDLKAKFGLETVEHNDDFMAALENGPWLWQGNQFYQTTGFYEWCDYVENSVNASSSTVAGPNGVGLEKALQDYADWTKNVFVPGYCAGYGYEEWQDTNSTACFNTYNKSSPQFTDTSLSNTFDRQWVWMTCNEPFGYWQDGAPVDRPTIVSRLVTADYWSRQCANYFPPGADGTLYGIANGKSEDDVNAYDGGWFITNSTRLIYANGGYDPWREATVSSELRPDGPLQSTPQVPVNIVPGGFHTSDFVTKNSDVNAGCRAVRDAEVDTLAAWVAEFPKRHHWQA